MTEERERKKRDIEMGSAADYRETHLSDQSTYIESIYIDKREQARSEKQAPSKRNQTQQALLDWVKYEVESRLKNSLHNRVSIPLEKEEDPTQVNPPWAIDVKIGTGQPFRLPSNTTITDIYDREDIKGRLLILGAPGSGKTTTLLQLAQVLINRAEKDVNQPIPALFNLSSWRDDKQSIKDWIIAELKLKYGVRKNKGQKLLEEAVIVPLLDGLDELASERQSLCVERINQFLHPSIWSSPLVVCSRCEEYKCTAKQLGLNASTILQPLNREKIRDYVLRTEGEKLWDFIKVDPRIMNLARTPLFLTMTVISSEKISFDKWQKLESSSKFRSYLFDAYIEMMLSRKYKGKQPIPDKTRHWLGWLAVQLEEQNQTEFLIETMQPYCLLKTKKKRLIFVLIFVLVVGLVVGLILGLIVGLIVGLIFVLIFGLGVMMEERFERNHLRPEGLFIQPVKTLSLERLRTGLIDTLILGPIGGLIGGLIFGLNGLIRGLVYGPIAGLIFVLIGSLAGDEMFPYGPEFDFTNYPNQGIKNSVKNAVILSIPLIAMLIIIALVIQPILNDLNLSYLNEFLLVILRIGIALSVILSGAPAIQHFSLRVVLWFSGYIPWNYARFLNYATNRLFLQRVGGRYRFIHRLLQEHFAQMYVE